VTSLIFFFSKNDEKSLKTHNNFFVFSKKSKRNSPSWGNIPKKTPALPMLTTFHHRMLIISSSSLMK
jgi:hypothetical protein